MALVLPCNQDVFNCIHTHDGRLNFSPHAGLRRYAPRPALNFDSTATLSHRLIRKAFILRASHPFMEPRQITPTGP